MEARQRARPDETAVSPVIGVILMVALTAILGGMIGVFIFDIGQDIDDTANADVDFNWDGDNVTASVIDPGNVDRLEITGWDGNEPLDANDDPHYAANSEWDWDASDEVMYVEGDDVTAGESFRYSPDDTGVSRDQMSVVGVVGDSENVLETYVNP